MSTPLEASPSTLALKDEVPDVVVNTLLDHAARMHASDLFLTASAEGTVVLVRRLGLMRPLAQLSGDAGHRCITHIKVMAGMDVAERRRPLDGRWRHEKAGHVFDLR